MNQSEIRAPVLCRLLVQERHLSHARIANADDEIASRACRMASKGAFRIILDDMRKGWENRMLSVISCQPIAIIAHGINCAGTGLLEMRNNSQ